MFAAKKYLLIGLVSACVEFLEQVICPDTVCAVLRHGVFFGEDSLKEKCLAFISDNAFRVFNTDGFLNMSHDQLKVVVSLEALNTTEIHVFESCVRWAKHQLLESGNVSPSDEEIRQQLGSVLYEIRFPTMTAEEFAKLTADSKILTGDEKNDVYVYIAASKRMTSLKFVADSRVSELAVKRFAVNSALEPWNCHSQCDAIGFETTVNVILTGVGLYGGLVRGSTHDVTLTVLRGGKILLEKKTKMTSSGRNEPVKVRFKRPVVIPANRRHVVAATITGPQTWSGVGAVVGDIERSIILACYSGNIAFYNAEQSANGTMVDRGQIPELYFLRCPAT